METVNPYFLLLRTSAVERKEQHWPIWGVGLGTRCLSMETSLNLCAHLSVGDKECLLTGLL